MSKIIEFAEDTISTFREKPVGLELLKNLLSSIYIFRRFAIFNINESDSKIDDILSFLEKENVLNLSDDDISRLKSFLEGKDAEDFLNLLLQFDFSLKNISKEEFVDLFYETIKLWGMYLSNSNNYFSAPSFINETICSIIGDTTNKTIYNPFGGVASLTKYIDNYSQFIVEEIESEINDIGKLFILVQEKEDNTFCNNNDSTKTEVDADIVISILPQVDSKEQLNDFISVIVNSINEGGKGIVVLPSVLYEEDSNLNKLYISLLVDKYIDAVIALPTGALYGKGIVSTMLVIDKSKNNEGIKFVDINSIESKHNSDCIVSKYKEAHITKHSDIDYKNGNVLLLPWRYKKQKISGDRVKLREFLKPIEGNKKLSFGLKLVEKDNVNRNLYEYKVNIEKCDIIRGQINLRVITKPTIVISLDKDFRIGYIEEKDVAISDDLLAFYVDGISVEYIIYQLNTRLFKDDIHSKSIKRNILSIDIDDFMDSNIVLLDESQQKYWIEEQKQIFLSQAEREKELVADMLGVQKSEVQILSTVKHSVNQVVGSINTDFLSLKRVINNKDKNKETISLEDKISKRAEARSVKDLLESVDNGLSTIKNIFTTMQKVINIEEKALDLKTISFKELLIEEAKPLLADNENFSLCYSFDSSSLSNDNITVDVDLFREVIRNFLANTIKYDKDLVWFIKHDVYLGFYLSVSDDEQYYIIDYKNNRARFPEGYTFDDFISYGKTNNADKGGTGIGGYIINKVIRKHGGSFNKIDSKEKWAVTINDFLNVNDFKFPNKRTRLDIELAGYLGYYDIEFERFEESFYISHDYAEIKLELAEEQLESLLTFKKEKSSMPNFNELLSDKYLKILREEGKYCLDMKDEDIRYKDVYEEIFKENDKKIQELELNIKNLKEEIEKNKDLKPEDNLSKELLSMKKNIERLREEYENTSEDEYEEIILTPNLHFQIKIPKL